MKMRISELRELLKELERHHGDIFVEVANQEGAVTTWREPVPVIVYSPFKEEILSL